MYSICTCVDIFLVGIAGMLAVDSLPKGRSQAMHLRHITIFTTMPTKSWHRIHLLFEGLPPHQCQPSAVMRWILTFRKCCSVLACATGFLILVISMRVKYFEACYLSQIRTEATFMTYKLGCNELGFLLWRSLQNQVGGGE